MSTRGPARRAAFARLAEFAVDRAGDCVFFIGPDADVLYANEAACKALEYTREQLEAMTVFDFDADITDAAWVEHWQRVKEQRHFTFESRHRASSGRVYPVEIAVNHVVFEGREYNCAFARDMGSRVAIERNVRQSEARKAAMLAAALDAVITIDEQGHILDFNPAAERIIGHAREDILGKEMSAIIIPKRLRTQHLAGLTHFLKTGDGPALGQRLELPAVRADGTEFPSEVSIHAIEVDGHFMFTAYLRDISDRKKSQHELEDARRQAEAANEAKSEFLARMSHDIRTPLTAIVGYADILTRSNPSPADVEKWCRVIRHNSEYLISLVNDVLDFSQIEAREITLQKTQVDVARFVTEVDSLFRPRAHEKGLDFHVRARDEIPVAVQTDKTRLKQVIVNLLGNAIKYTVTGSVTLEVRAVARDDGSVALTFDVIDTGPGVAADLHESLFEPFTRVQSGSDPVSGTGLGLSISRHFARLLGGDVTLVSEPAIGSTFSVTIDAGPVETVEWVDRSSGFILAPEEVPQLGLEPSMNGCRTLIVDDSPDNRRIVAFLVERAGGVVASAPHGAAALELLLEQAFDVVLLDMQMPVLDGYDTVRAMRARSDHTPVIALTAYSMVGDRERCLAAGCDGYVSKPVLQSDLFAEIDRVQVLPSATGAEPSTRSEREDDPGFAPLLLEHRASLLKLSGEIVSAREQSDADVLARLVHQVRGTGAAYGFPSLNAIADQCEVQMRSGVSIDGLGDEMDALVQAMQAIGSHSSSL